ncbi:MAG TPA: peptidylprolyl isomerase [Vicinamibacterales bacterium]|nr:peptidylprolyl isomerase [Vicinamibacterales bacterium]
MLLLAIVLIALVTAAPAQLAAPVIVVFETEKGAIEIEVDVARAPLTAANFLRYVDGGFYDGGRFHRAVRPDTETNKDVPIQVIQASRARGRQGFGPIVLERTSQTKLSHKDGVVSMARSASPDSAASDFFICLGDQPALDFGGKRNPDGQGFAAFGRVVKGMDVVKAIQASPVRPGSQALEPAIGIVKAGRR